MPKLMKLFASILLSIVILQDTLHAEKDEVVSLSLKEIERSFVAVFSNRTNGDVTILKPLDGSMWCWHMPYYDFSVYDSTGRSVSIGGRCKLSGLWAGTEWPKDYLIIIKAGESFELPLSFFPFDLEDGQYQVALSYIYSNDGTRNRKGLSYDYPKDLWTGRLKSNIVQFVVGDEIKKNGRLEMATPRKPSD